MDSLETRFHAFMRAIGALSIDDLTRGTPVDNESKADYLSADRRVVLEVKTLKTDTSPKVERELDKHRDREDFPLFYGEVGVDKILRHLPDGQEINARIFRNITRSVEDALLSAEKQIGNTRAILNLADGPGVLVLLNQEIEILDPGVVAHKLSELMAKERTRQGRVDFAWLLFESHVTTAGGAFPCIVFLGPTASNHTWFEKHLDALQAGWARFNRAPFEELNVQNISELTLQPSKKAPAGTGMRRQDLWKKAYLSRPYLRKLTDEQVLDSGAKAIEALTPYFIKGGPRIPLQQLEPKMIAWADFLAEAEHRGLDLKKMSAGGVRDVLQNMRNIG